jgi:hypothetical protein
MTHIANDAPATTYATAITTRDLSARTTDVHRDNWTVGKLNIVIAALGADAPVVLTIDRATGFTLIGATLGSAFDGGPGRGPRLAVTYRHEDGTFSATNYSARNIGPVIVPLSQDVRGAKWTATDLWSRISSAAVRAAAAEAGERSASGAWEANVDTARPAGDGRWAVQVVFRPTDPASAARWVGTVTVAPRER